MKTKILVRDMAYRGDRLATIHCATFLLLLALLVLMNGCGPSEQAATPQQALRNYFRAVISGNADALTKCYVGTAEQMEVVRAQAESMSAMFTFRDAFVERHGASAWDRFRTMSRDHANVVWKLEATKELDQSMIEEQIGGMKLRTSNDRAWAEGRLGAVRLIRRESSWFIDLASVVPAGPTLATLAENTRKLSGIIVGLTAFARRRDVTPEDIISELRSRIMKLEKEQKALPDQRMAEQARSPFAASPEGNRFFVAIGDDDADTLKRILAEKKVNVNMVIFDGNTPLHMAATLDRPAATRVLIGAGARMEARDKIGQTPLHAAATMGHAATVQALIEGGANLAARDTTGSTPLHMAVATGNTKTVRLLIEKVAAMDAQDDTGNTPLHYAAQERPGVAALLVRLGANPYAKNAEGITPVDILPSLVSEKK